MAGLQILMRRSMRLFALGLVVAAGIAGSARADHSAAVVVASKADTEGALLGSMIALILERENIHVQPRLQLGPTQAVRSAILQGAIDVYPEYTGNGALFHDMAESPVWKSLEQAYEAVKQLDAERHGLVWLDRAPANNTWAIALRGDVARRDNLFTMDDFARAVRGTTAIRLAASAEFVESPAALPAFEKTYDFRLPREQIVVLPTGDTAKTMRAAAQGANGVNAAMVYGTDGAIAALDLVVMRDVKGAQIVYEPAPVIRAEILQRHSGIAKALAPVFASLTMNRLQALNAEIVVEGRSPRDVAGRYLEQVGLRR
jgi:osmoprotectant transport system substrate-binding protein